MSALSLLGTGNMGAALVRTLASNGTELTIWNRTQAKAEALRQEGVVLASSSAAALAASPCTILNVTDYPRGRALLESAQATLAGKTIIQLTTGKPQEARDLAEFVRNAGGVYLDGAIMGYPPQVGTPQLQVLYSGDQAVFDEYAPVLEQLGGTMFLGEDPGAASAFDIAILIPLITAFVGLLQGLHVCRTEGIATDRYEPFVKQAISLFLDDALHKARQDDFATNPDKVECTVDLMANITELFSSYCQDIKLDPGLFRAIAQLFASGAKAGRGAHDWMCVAELHAD